MKPAPFKGLTGERTPGWLARKGLRSSVGGATTVLVEVSYLSGQDLPGRWRAAVVPQAAETRGGEAQ